ncbi:unnamed protein product [Moneuplotes crassus]|uniref:Uncharacterized protein n=1 Tax=Euplotes crassus TaxID=5936 RepID=A0AAD1XTH9_EUPCR|nr:unnamed protein product [Moneuplotes crassus]
MDGVYYVVYALAVVSVGIGGLAMGLNEGVEELLVSYGLEVVLVLLCGIYFFFPAQIARGRVLVIVLISMVFVGFYVSITGLVILALMYIEEGDNRFYVNRVSSQPMVIINYIALITGLLAPMVLSVTTFLLMCARASVADEISRQWERNRSGQMDCMFGENDVENGLTVPLEPAEGRDTS